MCGIVASFNKDKLIELYKLNAYRGEMSHSISIFNFKTNSISVKKYSDKINFDNIVINDNEYCIIHSQAPTNKKDNQNIHPAEYNTKLLWHNGIIKDFEVSRLKEKYNSNVTWDTLLLLYELSETKYISNLSNLNGSFSCLFLGNKKLFLFRNEISPLFTDTELNISSVKFNNSVSLIPNTFFEIDFSNNTLIEKEKFETFENPYNF